MDYQNVLKRLWLNYNEVNPSVSRIHSLLESRGEKVINDHVAIRTFDLDGVNIEALACVFKEVGYVEKDSYVFEAKKLNAKHYEHATDSMAPKVFISELKIAEFSPYVQEVAMMVAERVVESNIGLDELIFAQNVWLPIRFDVYDKLRQESEYAAWFYVYGFRANHFTVYVNQLKNIGSIEELNVLLKENDFALNDSGGEIKGSKEQFLKQSSTLADKIPVEFEEGVKDIPCCYYEFAERFSQPDGSIYCGFIAKSADKIFESTDVK